MTPPPDSQPGDPAGHGQPGQPGDPGVPGQPGDPGVPGQPFAAGQPGDTGVPGDPGDPGQPVAAGQPGDTGVPGQPGDPGVPGQPGDPGQPVDPGRPGDLGQPGEPRRLGEARQATEAVLLARAKAGDVAAFELLAGAHADRLFAVLLRLLGDRAAAADIAQEVMLRAWRGVGRFRGSSSFFTWLYRIAVNEASRSLARRARQPVTVPVDDALQLPAAAGQQPERQAELAELRRALGTALAALPPAQRTAIVLRDIEGLPTRDAAEIAGVSQAAFKSRLHEARLKLRAAIGDQALLDGM